MSDTATAAGAAPAAKPAMGVFECFLTFWVALCIIVGIALGQLLPGIFHMLGKATVAQVNIPVAVLIWVMIMPMLVKIDLAAMTQVKNQWRGICVDGLRELVRQTVLDGIAWLDLHPSRIRAVAARRPDRQLYRRSDPAGCGTLHSDGVRMVATWKGDPYFTLRK